ncbi:MAG: glycosyltransferase family 39 protein [Dechloromonas sp.]|nr:glycosyltransferase family 39 protein [Dechloromonas sp.]
MQSAGISLYVDEAQYWVWAQALAWGYFSKPPGIAALIAVSTHLFGDGLLGVKALSMLCYPLAAAFLWASARRLYDRNIADWAALTILTLPIFAWLGLFASTDALLTLFWCAALWAYQRALDQPKTTRWLFLGLICGLGLLAKYTMLACLVGALVHLLCLQRPLLASRGPWLALLVAVALLSPNIAWNIAHNFPTLRHTADITLQRPGGGGLALFEFLAAQLLALGPVLGGLAVFALRQPRALWRHPANQLLLCFSLPLLILVAVQAWRSGANANWAAPALAPVTLLVVAQLLRSRRQAWLTAAIAVNLLLTALIYHAPTLLTAVDRPDRGKLNPYVRAQGWTPLAEQLRPLLLAHPQAVLLADNRTVLSHLAYELRTLRPTLAAWNPDGGAGDHYKLQHDLATLPGRDAVLISEQPPTAALRQRFTSSTPLGRISSHIDDQHQRIYEVHLLHAFQGY